MGEFGKIVREKRLGLNLTIKTLAEKIGISEVQLSNVEFGYNLPRVNSVQKYANGLECDVEELTNAWLKDYYDRKSTK